MARSAFRAAVAGTVAPLLVGAAGAAADDRSVCALLAERIIAAMERVAPRRGEPGAARLRALADPAGREQWRRGLVARLDDPRRCDLLLSLDDAALDRMAERTFLEEADPPPGPAPR